MEFKKKGLQEKLENSNGNQRNTEKLTTGIYIRGIFSTNHNNKQRKSEK